MAKKKTKRQRRNPAVTAAKPPAAAQPPVNSPAAPDAPVRVSAPVRQTTDTDYIIGDLRRVGIIFMICIAIILGLWWLLGTGFGPHIYNLVTL